MYNKLTNGAIKFSMATGVSTFSLIAKKVGPSYREMAYGAPPLGVAPVVGSMAYGFAIKEVVGSINPSNPSATPKGLVLYGMGRAHTTNHIRLVVGFMGSAHTGVTARGHPRRVPLGTPSLLRFA